MAQRSRVAAGARAPDRDVSSPMVAGWTRPRRPSRRRAVTIIVHLSASPPAAAALGSTTPWAMPIDQRLDEAYSVLFTTDASHEATELLGEPEARAVRRIDRRSRVFPCEAVRCRARRNVAPDHRWRTAGNASQLARGPEPLVPGTIYELRFPLRHCAYAIAAGHRLRVGIASAEFQNAWPTGSAGAQHDLPRRRRTRRASCCRLRQRQCSRLPAAGVRSVTASAAQRQMRLARPDYAFHLDLVNDTVTCELRAR